MGLATGARGPDISYTTLLDLFVIFAFMLAVNVIFDMQSFVFAAFLDLSVTFHYAYRLKS